MNLSPGSKERFNPAPLLLLASLLASLAGIAAFLFLFLPDFNIYWLILSPIILAFYQTPAVLIFKLYKKHRDRDRINTD
ncbi:hypothetical protein ACFLT9_07205 [Acidobacteriota bacterium]